MDLVNADLKFDPSGEGQPQNPFVGLRPFEEEDTEVFFGREKQFQTLIQKLNDFRFAAVVGTSGSGKSSLVRAGLIPRLRAGRMPGASADWRIALFRPGGKPIWMLAEAIVRALHGIGARSPLPGALREEVESLESEIHSSPLGLRTAVEKRIVKPEPVLFEPPGAAHALPTSCHVPGKLPRKANLLIVVDQFEELFRYGERDDDDTVENSQDAREHPEARRNRVLRENDAEAFAIRLLEATKTPTWSLNGDGEPETGNETLPIYVLIAMRSEFLGDCSRIRGLPQAINEGGYLIPRLSNKELRSAIRNPLEIGGGSITDSLVEKLVNDISIDPDQLPVLQDALMQTWHGENCINEDDYERVGGTKGALSGHASRIWNNLPDEGCRKTAERLFRLLTKPGPDGKGLRRPHRFGSRTHGDVSEPGVWEAIDCTEDQARFVIESFRAESFLMPPKDELIGDDTYIDISHESLIRKWTTLAEWIKTEAGSGNAYQEILDAQKKDSELRAEGRRPRLLDEGELKSYKKIKDDNHWTTAWSKRYGGSYELVLKYLDASETAIKDEHDKEKEKDLEEKTRLKEQKEFAETRARNLEIEKDLAAVRATKLETENRLAAQKAATITFILSAALLIVLLVALGLVYAVSKNATRKQLASLSVRLAEQERDNPHAALAYMADALRSDPDQWSTVSAMFGNFTNYGQISARIFPHKDIVYWAAFSPQGDRAVTGSNDGTVNEWDVKTGKKIDFKLKEPEKEGKTGIEFKHLDAVSYAEFDRSGRFVVTASYDGTAKIWDMEGGKVKTLRSTKADGPLPPMNRARFSPDGKLIVTASADNTARVWHADSGEPLGEPIQHDLPVVDAVFDKQGTRIVTASLDGTAQVIGPGGERKTLRITHDACLAALRAPGKAPANGPDLTKVAQAQLCAPPDQPLPALNTARFSPDGKNIVTASLSGAIGVWDAANGSLKKILYDPSLLNNSLLSSGKGLFIAPVKAVEFSPDGRWLVTASEDGSALLWDTKNYGSHVILREQGGPDATRLPAHRAAINTVQFFAPAGMETGSPSIFVTASADGTAQAWQISEVDVSGVGDRVLVKPIGPPLYHQDAVYTAMFGQDGTSILTASADHTARVWVVSPQLPGSSAPGDKLLESSRTIRSADLSADFTKVAIASGDGVEVWNVNIKDGKPTGPSRDAPVNAVKSAIVANAVTFSSDGKWVVIAYSDDTAQVWDPATKGASPGERIRHNPNSVFRPGPTGLLSAAFSHGQKPWRLVTASSNGTAMVWDLDAKDASKGVTAKPATTADGKKLLLIHSAAIASVEFDLHDELIVTASDDGTARVWDLTTGDKKWTLPHDDRVNTAVFSPDGQWVLTASEDKTAKLWNAKTGVRVATLPHNTPVRSASFSRDGKLIVTATMGDAQVWDAATGLRLGPALISGKDGQRYQVSWARFSDENGMGVITGNLDEGWKRPTSREAGNAHLSDKIIRYWPVQLSAKVISTGGWQSWLARMGWPLFHDWNDMSNLLEIKGGYTVNNRQFLTPLGADIQMERWNDFTSPSHNASNVLDLARTLLQIPDKVHEGK